MEMVMKKQIPFLTVLLATLCIVGCKRQVVVRDAAVYKNQTKFLQAVADQEADALESLIAKNCTCEGDADALEWSTPECEQAAEVLVIERATVQYRVDMMLYLGGLIEERPSKDAPEIPENTTACP